MIKKLKVGDRVIVRKAKNPYDWVEDEMDKYNGQEFIIDDCLGLAGDKEVYKYTLKTQRGRQIRFVWYSDSLVLLNNNNLIGL